MVASIRKVLFPVDFSHRCALAASHVKTWVDHFHAALITLHIVDVDALGHSPERDVDWVVNNVPHLKQQRAEDLKYFSDHYLKGDAVRQVVLSGCAREQIVQFAQEENVDLIMLPRDHQTLGSRWLHDSLAARILEQSTAAVWTTEHLKTIESHSLHRLLCAVHFDGDLTLDSQNDRILQVVRELAINFHAQTTFLHVINKQEESINRSFADQRTLSGTELWLAQAREQFGDSAEYVRASGDALTLISKVAIRVAADLIVVGRTRPGTIGLGVQGHILKIDHAVRCPVLSIC